MGTAGGARVVRANPIGAIEAFFKHPRRVVGVFKVLDREALPWYAPPQ